MAQQKQQEKSRKGNKHAVNTNRRERKARNYMKKHNNRTFAVNADGSSESGTRTEYRRKVGSPLSTRAHANTGSPSSPLFRSGQRKRDQRMVDWLILRVRSHHCEPFTIGGRRHDLSVGDQERLEKAVEKHYREMRRLLAPRNVARDAALHAVKQARLEILIERTKKAVAKATLAEVSEA